jgi:hypothetical protein
MFQNGLKGLGGLPCRMICSHGANAIENEEQLKIDRFFRPQRSIVIKDRDPLCRLHVIFAVQIGHITDEFNDASFRGPFVP